MKSLIKSFMVLLLILVLIPVLAGCGDGMPRCYPVSGTVYVDGKPLEGEFDGTIRFVSATPDEKYGRPATSQIDANGHFALTSFKDGDGCPKGTYGVELYVYQQKGNKTLRLVPSRCESAATSQITAEVTGATSEMKIDVTWLPEDAADRKPVSPASGLTAD